MLLLLLPTPAPQIMAVSSADAVLRMGSPIRDTDISQILSLCQEYLLNDQILKVFDLIKVVCRGQKE